MRIVTVLRSGGEYLPEHVERLRKQCRKHSKAEFVCFADTDVPGRKPLLHGWPGWWSKIHVFRLHGPCFFVDLDTTICGDIASLLDLAKAHPFIALRDFNFPVRIMGSGVMAWSGDMRHLYRTFASDPERHMLENRSGRWLGDQGFLERRTQPEFWQDLAPGAVVSWKKHCGNGIPEGARVVAFHGRPRPWEVGQ